MTDKPTGVKAPKWSELGDLLDRDETLRHLQCIKVARCAMENAIINFLNATGNCQIDAVNFCTAHKAMFAAANQMSAEAEAQATDRACDIVESVKDKTLIPMAGHLKEEDK